MNANPFLFDLGSKRLSRGLGPCPQTGEDLAQGIGQFGVARQQRRQVGDQTGRRGLQIAGQDIVHGHAIGPRPARRIDRTQIRQQLLLHTLA